MQTKCKDALFARRWIATAVAATEKNDNADYGYDAGCLCLAVGTHTTCDDAPRTRRWIAMMAASTRTATPTTAARRAVAGGHRFNEDGIAGYGCEARGPSVEDRTFATCTKPHYTASYCLNEGGYAGNCCEAGGPSAADHTCNEWRRPPFQRPRRRRRRLRCGPSGKMMGPRVTRTRSRRAAWMEPLWWIGPMGVALGATAGNSMQPTVAQARASWTTDIDGHRVPRGFHVHGGVLRQQSLQRGRPRRRRL